MQVLIVKVINILFFFIFSYTAYSQNLVISNIFKGKLLALGWNPGWNLEDEIGELDINCSQCTTTINAYVLAIEINATNNENKIEEKVIEINNELITFNEYSRVGIKKNINNNGNSLYVHFKQFDYICLNNKLVFDVPKNDPLYGYTGYFIVLECENIVNNLINYSLVLNTKDNNPNMIIDNTNPLLLNPINTSNDIGFSIIGHTFNFLNGDASIVKLNNFEIGTIAGQDLSSNQFYGSGVRGHFSYQNGIMTGEDDDTQDNQMAGTDALAKINNYVSNNNLFWSCIHEIIGNQSNYVEGAIIPYSSNCLSFNYSVTSDTTVCPYIPLQLSASGGTVYEWQSSTGTASDLLSCTDCPNPIFIGDKSTLLTVRIWNNDTCSVVRPIKVNVHPKPSLNNLTTTNTDCGTDNGKVVLTAQTPIASYRLDNGIPQTGITFNDLSKGLHTLQLTDAFGCVTDTFFTIKDTIRTIAKYYPSPGFGYLPLEVDFLNQSSFATEYDWKINASYFVDLNNYTFDSAGVYDVTLYAWQFDATCVDSFSLKISVYDNFSFAVPNIFSPNEDGKNDSFGLSSSNEVEVSYEILNRWGNVVTTGTVSGKGFVVLWDGSSPLPPSKGGIENTSSLEGGSRRVNDGTYYYKLSISLKEALFLPEETQNGVIDQTDFPIKADGWVQVLR